MALTVGEYLYKRLVSGAKTVPMDIADMVVEHAQVVKKDRTSAQLLQIEAQIDLDEMTTLVQLYNLDDGQRSEEPFATTTVRYGDADEWMAEFGRMSWLVQNRIQALDAMVPSGTASRLSRGLTYTLFKNVVDYTEKYRGMHSVVIHDFEAYADVILAPERHGTWHTPPHWIDSLYHVGGFICNGSEASNTVDYFYVTNGWSSCRMARPAVAGGKYRSYVRMAPTDEPNMFSGDVYVMQGDEVIGMMGGMRFRRVNRILMDKFFSPPDSGAVVKASSHAAAPAKPKATSKAKSATTKAAPAKVKQVAAAPKSVAKVEEMKEEPVVEQEAAAPAAVAVTSDVPAGITGDALKLIAKETGLELSELSDEASFVELGVDSLTSLVLAETFKKHLAIEVKSSLFLECTNVGDLKAWLEQNA